MISIVDYGLGNVQAFANIYKRLGIPTKLAKTAVELADATHIILPGVGAFDWAMTRLNQSGMRETLDNLVLEHNTPVLGVCVGMQMMASNSDEGSMPGLGWFDASVRLFDESSFETRTHLPHMGWNVVDPVGGASLFDGMGGDARFYFLHSYYFEPSVSSDVLGTTSYGGKFTSAVKHKQVHGVQFHPEKSHSWGINLLKNFASI